MDDAAGVQDEKKDDDFIRVPPPPPLDSAKKPFECDFDQDPTELYLTLQRKDWIATTIRARDCPVEARTWVSRKERDGKLRWRLLPIHAAIIFKAPETVVEALLAAYPKGAQCKDDQGMLPLHLAFRNGSTEGVVNLLLVAYPQSIDVKDRKGRIPLVLAQASTSPNRDAFMRALERGPTYYAVAAAATERAAVTAEQRAIFDAKIIEIRNNHHHEVAELQELHQKTQEEYALKIKNLETELARTQETSQVLVDHVNSLEAQLNSRSDTERFLATKIATLDSSLKETIRQKETVERSARDEKERLVQERDDLAAKLNELEEQHLRTSDHLNRALTEHQLSRDEMERNQKEMEHQIRKLEVEWANSRANAAILEMQFKKKMETEHALASQVSALASRLAESAAESGATTSSYVSRIRVLEEERNLLRATIQQLSIKLQRVAQVLDDMTLAQDSIIQQAALHEERMAQAAAAHAQIVACARKQEDMHANAKLEREHIALILQKQEEQVQQSAFERRAILEAVEQQTFHMNTSASERETLVLNVSKMRNDIKEILDYELSGIPVSTAEGDEDYVDAVVKHVTAGTNARRKEAPQKKDLNNVLGTKQTEAANAPQQDMQAELSTTVSTLTSSSLVAQPTDERELDARYHDLQSPPSLEPEGSKADDDLDDRIQTRNEDQQIEETVNEEEEEKKDDDEIVEAMASAAAKVLTQSGSLPRETSTATTDATSTSGYSKIHASLTDLEIARHISSGGMDAIVENRLEDISPVAAHNSNTQASVDRALSMADRIEAARNS
jgi:hypothetical protein